MDFTEKKAQAYIEKYNLAPTTLAVWKTRGSIPDKYAAGALPEKITSSNELQQLRHLIRALQMEKLKPSPLSLLAGLKRHILEDVKREKGNICRGDFIATKKAINILRIQVKEGAALLAKKNIGEIDIERLHTLFSRTEIAWFVVVDRDRKTWGKLEGWRGGRRSFPTEIVEQLSGHLLVFLAETTI